MDRRDAGNERRLGRRVPVGGIEAAVHVPGLIRPVVGRCTDLAVGGMTLVSSYVPRDGEQLRVEVASPGGASAIDPLHVRVCVRRCHPLPGGEYELGLEIVEVIG
ncbi:MAG: PilZ domain-containing protein [Rhodocyclaceae bacterium]|nr:PilZ domain-containing protein [Rhodocyclaceae bacterium]